MKQDYIQEENISVKVKFDLDLIVNFTLDHEVQIIRGPDYQYVAVIDRQYYGSSITPMHALWFGIQSYLNNLP